MSNFAYFLLKARKIVADHKAEYIGIYTMGGKGGGTTSNTSTTTVPPEVLAEYKHVVDLANQYASTPLQQYQGQMVANTTPTQQSAYNTIDNSQGISRPFTGAAANLLGQSAQTINPQTVGANQIQQYMSPYTQNVLNTSMAAQNNQDAQQQAQLQGNAISSGAWGGDRSAVAQGILGGQQALANNATNAGILNQGYSQALTEANTQQQAALGAQQSSQYLQQAAGLGMNQLGTSAQTNALQGAGAQLASGQAQQQQEQAQLNVPYQQFLQQQAYPFQTTGWLGNIAEGIGSNTGSSTSGTSTAPSQGLFSDKRLKENIHKVGIMKGEEGEYPVYTYNYKGDSAPQFGVIAQEVEKKNPKAVHRDNSGYLKVDYNKLARGGIVQERADGGIAPQHFDDGGASFLDNLYNPSTGNGIIPAIAQVESRNNPNAVSPVGAQGAYQIMPATAADPGYGVTPLQGKGDEKRFATDYHQALLSHFNGDENMALMAYNGGPGRLDKVAQGKTSVSDLPTETQQYPGKVMAAMGTLPSQDINTGTEGQVMPSPTPPVSAKDHPDNMPTKASDYLSQMPHNHEANPWMSVAAGVLGTLAGRSRNPFIDIGQGGLIGLNNYEQQVNQAQAQNYQEGTFANNAQKLSDEAKHQRDTFAEEKTRDSNTKQLQDAQIAHLKATVEQGKVGFNQYGQPVYTTGPQAGQIVPQKNVSSDASGNPMISPGAPDFSAINNIASNIGIKPNYLNIKNRSDTQQAAKMQADAYNNVGQLSNGISNFQRIEQLLPQIDQGMMATASRAAQKAWGEPNATADTANYAALSTLPLGSKERAAYEEISKLEGNAALQNEVSQGIGSKTLGFNMVKLGQNLFANPEMTKEAQKSILDKAIFASQTAKEANEITPQLEGVSPGTITQAKQKYFNDSYSSGYAIPANDYITGSWKKQGYTPPTTQGHYKTSQSSANSVFDYNSIKSGQQYTAPDGSIRTKP